MRCFRTALAALVAGSMLLGGCQTLRRPDSARTTHGAPSIQTPAQGTFDNHEQVWQSHENAANALPPPHVVVAIEATGQPDWSIWRIRLDASPALDAAWAMRRTTAADGSQVVTPYRALVAMPDASKFDAQQWTALDACALRGAATGSASADASACAAIAPGIGTQAALLPLSFERDGDMLRLRLYADQARGADAREDLRLVRWFGGWAAINGGGPKAEASSNDWHMDRNVRLGSEGGRYALKWRDGNASGYSLALERLTYREGNVPVLKLSVVEDADGHAIAYAWANPEATAIGINLGWVQVGLNRLDATMK